MYNFFSVVSMDIVFDCFVRFSVIFYTRLRSDSLKSINHNKYIIQYKATKIGYLTVGKKLFFSKANRKKCYFVRALLLFLCSSRSYMMYGKMWPYSIAMYTCVNIYLPNIYHDSTTQIYYSERNNFFCIYFGFSIRKLFPLILVNLVFALQSSNNTMKKRERVTIYTVQTCILCDFMWHFHVYAYHKSTKIVFCLDWMRFYQL